MSATIESVYSDTLLVTH